MVAGRKSPRSLYRTDYVTFEADQRLSAEGCGGFHQSQRASPQDPRACATRARRRAHPMRVHVALGPAEFRRRRSRRADRPRRRRAPRHHLRGGRLRGGMPTVIPVPDEASARRAASRFPRRVPPGGRAGRRSHRGLRPRQFASRVHPRAGGGPRHRAHHHQRDPRDADRGRGGGGRGGRAHQCRRRGALGARLRAGTSPSSAPERRAPSA